MADKSDKDIKQAKWFSIISALIIFVKTVIEVIFN